MKTAQEIAEEAIINLDIEDAKGADDDSKKTDEGADDTGADKGGDSAGGDDDKGAGGDGTDDGGAGTDDKGKKDDKADEGTFTADDALEVDDKPAPNQPEAPKDAAGIQLSADEQKHIVDNIGEPIVIRGIRGEGENAKEVELKVYSSNEIPADFKFANDQQLAAASTGFLKLEQKAQQLLGSYRDQQSGKAAQDFEQRENQGIRDDVADLQKEGMFPKFRVKPGDVGFDEDPAAQQMGEVLKLMTERNEMYLKQYNQGRPYRHIGFREAFEIYQAKQPAKQRNNDQAAEDKARKGVADKVATGRGLTSEKLQKATIRPGTTIEDILNRHEQDFE